MNSTYKNKSKQKINAKKITVLFDQGILHHQQGQLSEAKLAYQNILELDQRNFDAIHMLGVISYQEHNYKESQLLLKKAIIINPKVSFVHSNYGNTLIALNNYEKALESYDTALKINPKEANDHFNRANTLKKMGRLTEAIQSYDRALKINPNDAEFYYNKGLTFQDNKQWEAALKEYQTALKIHPQYVLAYINQSIALKELKWFDQALETISLAIKLAPNNVELYINQGNIYRDIKKNEEALKSYQTAIKINNKSASAYNNQGVTLKDLGRSSEAKLSFEKAIEIDQRYSDPHFNLGNMLMKSDRLSDALTHYQAAIDIDPNNAYIYYDCGVVLQLMDEHEQAMNCYAKSLELNSDQDYLYGSWLFMKQRICEWSNYQKTIDALIHKIQLNLKPTPPFLALALLDDGNIQKIIAKSYLPSESSNQQKEVVFNIRQNSEKIRIGYFSADFHDHATMRLMAELFEKHDKQKFELYAYSFGPDSQDQMRQRAIKAFDHFHEVRGLTDLEIAELARKDQIDIAIDLKGYTYDMRVGIFANRAAPIQINYLGYPGTMGADYIDYIIADHTIIPQQYQHLYTEKIIRLPGSYQVNDRSRNISNHPYTRAEVGLPEAGFIFCSFNNNYKITPNIFDVWMRILKAIDSSVLWLLEDNPIASANLKKEAKIRGVAPERLIFAKRLPMAEHLARQKLADLFIDTYPCNAHTTASDALWVGLPLLTIAGETFASRVAASLLQAIEVPELITENMIEYEKKAIQLAQNPIQLSQLKQKLKQKKLETPLFDTTQYTKNLEDALIIVYDHFHSSKLSTSI